VTAHEIGPDYITIELSDGAAYRLQTPSTGQEKVEPMNGLAQAGQGLSTLSSTTVMRLYERKEKKSPMLSPPAPALSKQFGYTPSAASLKRFH
jgi:hypothetical protein